MISMSGSATNSAYEPYAFVLDGAWTSLRKASARETEEEEAAAAMMCCTSWTSRVAGFVRRSLVNASRG